jgi:uncharacterized surface protein with fasciclin (FAS1) repeats
MKKSIFTVAAICAMTISMTSCSSNEAANTEDNQEMSMENDMTGEKMEEESYVMVGGAKMVPSLDIVDNALNADNVTTLVAAVKAAGLVETLKSEGPFTVFAPTDAAFDKLPAGTVETLVKPENKGTLTSILTYHVVAGALTASDLRDGMKLKTVNGQELSVSKKDGKWYVDNALVTIPNVISSNGVTHVIDAVMLPK